jgi:apolipoprotein N-acyltransferase
MFLSLLFGSFFLVAFGQPALVPYLGIAAGAVGFALFWRASCFFEKRSSRFWLGLCWYGAVQGVQLFWMASPHYVGSMILVVYAALLLSLGSQFGFLCLWVKKEMSLRSCAAIAGLWVLLEWTRLFVLTGFSFNPVGLALSDLWSVQLAAVGGVYALSFWVVFVNALFLRQRKALWAIAALFPYLFGWTYQTFAQGEEEKSLRVALVQTALLPEQRHYTAVDPEAYIEPLEQWRRVWDLLPINEPLDLIVFPESAFPYRAFRPLISYGKARQVLSDFPEMRPQKLSNALLSQALAERHNAHVIVGLDDDKYNAAFHFQPASSFERYEKRVLVPVSEYLPLETIDLLSVFYAKQYGIFDSCKAGTSPTVFSTQVPIGPCICYEETYPGVIRQLRRNGAKLFVNISNDAWYPGSLLAKQHFHHGRIRAVENGVYLLRSCNTGITAIVDYFGKTVAALPFSETKPGVLFARFSPRSLPTLYTFWGDAMILCLSAICLFWLPRNSTLS